LQGEEHLETAKALRQGDLEAAPITPAERLLLKFVGTLTQGAYRITDQQVQDLRDAGWSDAQIAEAVYDGALFNMFVRIADAFNIHPPPAWEPEGVPAAVVRE
jgi:alkylhydroperoxidase family enzyme